MSPAVENLVSHVQDIVTPSDRMPNSIDSPMGISASRREPPEWLNSGDSNEQLWDDDDEISLPPGETVVDPIEMEGVVKDPDVHAFYLPFHFYRHSWGIYVRAKSVVTLTAHLLKRNVLKGDSTETAVARGVFRMLLEHETFHHLTELAISRLELIALEYMRGDSLYARNFHRKDSVELEEGMANAYALRELGQSIQPMRYTIRSTIEALISGFMEKQPAGYRDFEQYLGDAAFKGGQDDIITEAKVCSPRLGSLGGSDGVLVGRAHFVERARSALCPVRLVFEKGVPLRRIRPFPKRDGMRVYVYTRDEHPPAHFHLFMPPEREHGSYGWPGLDPLPGSPALSKREADTLRRYIRGCQPKIYEKMCAVFEGVPDMQ